LAKTGFKNWTVIHNYATLCVCIHGLICTDRYLPVWYA